MSTYYTLYLEAKINGEWKCLNHEIPYLDDRTHESPTYLSETYWSGSRSYFQATADKLLELGYRGNYEELSEQIRSWYKYDDDDDDNDMRFFNCIITPLDIMRNIMPKGFLKECHGIVHKNTIFAYETGDIEDIYECLSSEEYAKLTCEEKRLYQYYEWNSPDGWYGNFKNILEHAYWQLYEWKLFNENEIGEARIVCIIS